MKGDEENWDEDNVVDLDWDMVTQVYIQNNNKTHQVVHLILVHFE